VLIEILAPKRRLFILIVEHSNVATAEALRDVSNVSPIFACKGKSNVKLKRRA
jgi:hypothetical protein